MEEKLKDIGIFLAAVGVALAIIAIPIGIKMLIAHFVYHDVRCAFAECRIQVDQNQ